MTTNRRKLIICFRLFGIVQTLFFTFLGISALILGLVSVHSLSRISDPLKSVGSLDKLSLWLGVQEQSAVVIIHLEKFQSRIYTYIYQRQLSDNSFYILKEYHDKIIHPVAEENVHGRIKDIVNIYSLKYLPYKNKYFTQNKRSNEKVPILVRFHSE